MGAHGCARHLDASKGDQVARAAAAKAANANCWICIQSIRIQALRAMLSVHKFRIFAPVVLAALCVSLAQAGGVRISIPKRSEATPVQKLNREGVKQIQHHHLAKAEQLFYKAYLIDPDDPFTLNNLGYISELQGKIDRAQRYYELAAKESNSDTVIALASTR